MCDHFWKKQPKNPTKQIYFLREGKIFENEHVHQSTTKVQLIKYVLLFDSKYVHKRIRQCSSQL